MAKYRQWTEGEGLARIEALAATHTDAEIAAEIGVTPATFKKWCVKYDALPQAMARGRQRELQEQLTALAPVPTGAPERQAVEAVEAALLDRCLGGVRNVEKGFKVREREYDEASGRCVAERERVELAMEQVYVPADTAAIRFFLTNRDPRNWKNRADMEEIGAEGVEEYLRRLDPDGSRGRYF